MGVSSSENSAQRTPADDYPLTPYASHVYGVLMVIRREKRVQMLFSDEEWAMLQELATRDGNQAVRRLAIVTLRNGSPQRETIQILAALGNDDEQDRELRDAAAKVAQALRKKAGPAR